MRLTDFTALTFDCYGTLIDWESGMIEALKPLAAKASHPLSRNDIGTRQVLRAKSSCDSGLRLKQ